MLNKFSKRILFWPAVLVVGLIFGSALQIALAWTVPSATPPGSNVAPPLNTSATDQTKTGSLIINGAGEFIRASHFSDQNNTGYYLDPNGSSVLNNVTAGGAINATGIVQSGTYIRAPYFTDHNNTAYYLDPNSTSRLSHATIDNLNSLGYVNANVNLVAGAYMQAPLFYDNDDINYYADPHGTSRINNLNALGLVNVNRIKTNSEADMGGGTINASQLCIAGDCKSAWPSGGGGGSCTVVTRTGTNPNDNIAYCPAGYQIAGGGFNNNGGYEFKSAPYNRTTGQFCTNGQSAEECNAWKVCYGTGSGSACELMTTAYAVCCPVGSVSAPTGGGAGITGEMTIYGSTACPTGWTLAYSGTASAISYMTLDMSDTKCYDVSSGNPPNRINRGPCSVCLPESGTYVAYKGVGPIACASGWTSVYSGTAAIPIRYVTSSVGYAQAGSIDCYQAVPSGSQAAGTCNVCRKGTAGSGEKCITKTHVGANGNDNIATCPSDYKLTGGGYNGQGTAGGWVSRNGPAKSASNTWCDDGDESDTCDSWKACDGIMSNSGLCAGILKVYAVCCP